MLNLVAAALVAAQPVPVADAHAQHSAMPAATAQHEQHEGMKDCCKDCCKDMKGHEGHMSKGETTPKRGE